MIIEENDQDIQRAVVDAPSFGSWLFRIADTLELFLYLQVARLGTDTETRKDAAFLLADEISIRANELRERLKEIRRE